MEVNIVFIILQILFTQNRSFWDLGQAVRKRQINSVDVDNWIIRGVSNLIRISLEASE